ncbi:ABC transporter permease [Silvibacterium acidisoli]|uniref:ABC transporter permease n=1 Tax=Acidobacteriaceae bacterium ZG23-2 TaxID=2883246 RepID=UPI00406CC3E1
MQTLRQDIAYALRQMKMSPVFTLAAMLTLALGIGATTAIFSLIHSVMLKSLPVVDPSSLYRIGQGNDCCVNNGPQDPWGMFPYELYKRFTEAAPQFEQVAAFQAGGAGFSVRRSETDHVAKPLNSEFVSGNYFQTFGIKAFAGRIMIPSDDQPSATPVAMMSYRAWQKEYGGDPSVIGSSFVLNGHPVTIIGITPPGFYSETLRSDPPALYVPLQQEPLLQGPSSILKQTNSWLRIIGRLKPGASIQGLDGKLTAILQNWWVTDFPGQDLKEYLPQIKAMAPKQKLTVIPAGGGVATMKADYSDSLHILLAVCCLVLLIACANIANLLMARGTARRPQTSVRLALGASRKRLIMQSLTESVVLALFGGLAGLVVAYGGVKLIVALAFHSAHYVPIDSSPSLPILAFGFALSLVTGLLFGTAPAWITSHANPAEALRGANRSTRDSSSLPQKILVIMQATLSIVLLAGAGLLTRSLQKMQHQDFGFETDHRVNISLGTPFSGYPYAKLDATYQALQERLSRIPGVESAALAQYTPFTDNWGEMVIREGHGVPDVNTDQGSSWDHVSAGYLELMGQKILRGRSITEQDSGATQKVAVVDEAFIRKFFKPGENPIGAHFGLDKPQYSGTYEIIGVVREANYTDPAGNWRRPLFFVPLAQHVKYDIPMMQNVEDRTHLIEAAVLKLHGNITNLEPQVRQALADVNPDLTLIEIRTMDQQVANRLDQRRSVAQMTGLFGILALILAAVGLYGVTAYTVERRTSEIGVRMALGANRVSVIGLVLRGAFAQILLGLAIGIPISIGCSRLIANQLYQVKGWDPLVLTISVLALAICALFASVIPAQRAASIDPVKALRAE